VPNKFEKRIFSSHDGIDLVADIGGPAGAPTVLLMHGGGQTRHSWSGAMHSLVEEGYRVLNLDLRGHGESAWSRDNQYPLLDFAKDAAAALEAEASSQRVLVGASLGGMASLTAVALTGLKAQGVVLVDIAPQVEEKGVQRILDFMSMHLDGFDTLEQAADAVSSYNPERKRPPDPSGLRKNLREGTDGRLRWHWDPGILHSSHKDNEALFQYAARLIGERGDPEVLLVRGLASDVVSDEGVEMLHRTIPRSTVHNVEAAGHMVAGDRNDRFNQGTIAFLRRVLPLS
jgi:pimeloyl-ACP methyl ester carboxylesterase